MTNMIAKERLYLTADKSRLVREGDEAGATLYCAPGDEIPPSAVDRFKLVDGTIGKGKPVDQGNKGGGAGGGTKEKQPGPDKEKQPGEDKGGADQGSGDQGGAGGAAYGADDLTQIKFVGSASATALAAAGFTTIAQLAAIDPANPPAVEGMGARVNWGAIVASAIELHEAGDEKESGEAGSGGAGQGES